jgi:hypothetical protein
MNKMLNIVSLDYISLAIVIVSGILVLFGIYKILRQGISLLFWVLLIVIGTLGLGYVLKPDLTSHVVNKIKSGEFISLISEEQKDLLRNRLNQPATQSNN